jgi:hypothetical protein
MPVIQRRGDTHCVIDVTATHPCCLALYHSQFWHQPSLFCHANMAAWCMALYYFAKEVRKEAISIAKPNVE